MAISLDSLIEHETVPAEMPLTMEQQDFSTRPKNQFESQFKSGRTTLPRIPIWERLLVYLARLSTFGGALGLTIYATYQMTLIVSLATVTGFQWAMVVLFAITFAWISLAATSALSGLLFNIYKASGKPKSPLTTKTALLMPVYNEDAACSFSALAAMANELEKHEVAEHFEIFVISDTNTPTAWVKETAAISELKQTLKSIMPVWYRRRDNNAGKKAGNVQDFVTRWGGRYDFMLVLDADSIMSAKALCTLVNEMEADSRCGILQTLPKLYGGETLFARLQQFASYAYSETVALGISSWQGSDGNYWGHNALIRMQAFSMAAGLPHLPGRKPFGGPIMAHDFVEAALIRRSGWTVKMLPWMSGSWEEGPPSLDDVAVRDRRWAQGNLQHLKVMSAKGLKWSNRAHMLIGVMSYLASPLWLALITVGLITYFQTSGSTIDYFQQDYSLFPTWPIFDSERMIELFILTMVVLLLPKAIGFIRLFLHALVTRPLSAILLPFGVVIETFFSILYAPIFMLIHTKQIFEIFSGRDSGWQSQQRKGHSTNWLALFKRHALHTLIGIGLTVLLFSSSTSLLLWMSPTLIGLVFALPLAALSGSRLFGLALRKCGLLAIPEERKLASVMKKRRLHEQELSSKIENLSVESVLKNDRLAGQHYAAVTHEPCHKRGKPNLDLVAVELKIKDARSVNEALGWMSDREKMTLLSKKELRNHLIELDDNYVTNRPEPLVSL